jgi:phosphatidylserine decarboxylase
MHDIFYIDRKTGEKKKEKVYGHFFLKLLYGEGFVARALVRCIAHFPLFSKWYGFLQRSAYSRRKVRPFIEEFDVDASEFLEQIDAFKSFNDFFIRRLKPEARPLDSREDILIAPADARYLVFPAIDAADGFWVKGKKFSVEELVQDAQLAKRYAKGAMAIARLCPVDYHRFHFPCDALPSPARLINGPLYSVSPLALKKNISYLSENKRMITTLQTKEFGTVLFIEVGATNVGSIHQTFTPNHPCVKGEEKGYFSFGGSCILLLFEKERISFDADLIRASNEKVETLVLLGQSLGCR